ncbi:MAG: GIY-YIG nuclease family protein [bacterium]|nr:GIY-YIG nuclease family protein [bacterium]
MHEKIYCMYIATNQRNTVLYTGMSGQLPERMTQHKEHRVPGFTKRYNIEKLVYYEVFETPYDAIAREKEIKGWLRAKKIKLIEAKNPEWSDLSNSL